MIKKTLKVGFSRTKNANYPKLKGSQVANGGVEDDEKKRFKNGRSFQGRKRAVFFQGVYFFCDISFVVPSSKLT